MYDIKQDNTIIKINFYKPFYKNLFKYLYFTPNKDVIYYDNSHVNYIYNITIDNIIYTFYGFFKDNFFAIIFDSFDSNLQINIENKYLFLIKLDWQLLEIEDNKKLWVLEYSKLNNLKSDIFILNVRINYLKNQYINMIEYMKISEYEQKKINVNKVENNKSKTFINKYLEKFGLITC